MTHFLQFGRLGLGRISRWLLATLRWISVGGLLLGSTPAPAQGLTGPGSAVSSTTPFRLSVGLDGGQQPQDVDVAIKVLFAMTLLTLAPSIVLLMTCFTRIVIVLSFVRSALSLQGTPANQIIIGLSLFITFFIMEPVWEKIETQALKPYQAKQITSDQALAEAA